jgi:GDP/UDP-N,N'-diacetylbacillosamine 2-epimerase (hydrolysing)
MQGIQNHPDLVLQIIATGMHVSKDFGYTYKEIEADGFQINKKVETLSGLDSNIGILEAMGKGLIGCGEALEELKPDLIIILGDRFEIFVAAVAAHMSRIPIAHLHGGELTIGAYDDALRHSITKMSQLHFVANEEYRNRVIQLGEDPKNVFLVGGLGVDQIQKTKILSRIELEKSLKIEFRNKSLLITYHPVTLEEFTSSYQVQE